MPQSNHTACHLGTKTREREPHPQNKHSVRGSPNGTIGKFTNGTSGGNVGTNSTNGAIGENVGTNGTISRTLNDIGLPLVPLVKH